MEWSAAQMKQVLSSLFIIRPPHPVPADWLEHKHSVFLAGSIEMGVAGDWQEEMIDLLSGHNVLALNPRRVDWDSTWEQRIDNPQFNEQVTWELDGLSSVDWIIMYLDPKTKAPISLLELGLFASSGKLLVCCPEGFYRKGNVDIVCARYNVPMFDSLQALADGFLSRIKEV